MELVAEGLLGSSLAAFWSLALASTVPLVILHYELLCAAVTWRMSVGDDRESNVVPKCIGVGVSSSATKFEFSLLNEVKSFNLCIFISKRSRWACLVGVLNFFCLHSWKEKLYSLDRLFSITASQNVLWMFQVVMFLWGCWVCRSCFEIVHLWLTPQNPVTPGITLQRISYSWSPHSFCSIMEKEKAS